MTAIVIKSLAALSRAVAPGCRVHVVAHWQPQLVDTWRTPIKVQRNGYSFRGPKRDGVECVMWCYHPTKRAEVRFNDDGSVTYYPDTSKAWTLMYYAPDAAVTP